MNEEKKEPNGVSDDSCKCPKKPGGIMEVDDLKSMVHSVCGKVIRMTPPQGANDDR